MNGVFSPFPTKPFMLSRLLKNDLHLFKFQYVIILTGLKCFLRTPVLQRKRLQFPWKRQASLQVLGKIFYGAVFNWESKPKPEVNSAVNQSEFEAIQRHVTAAKGGKTRARKKRLVLVFLLFVGWKWGASFASKSQSVVERFQLNVVKPKPR